MTINAKDKYTDHIDPWKPMNKSDKNKAPIGIKRPIFFSFKKAPPNNAIAAIGEILGIWENQIFDKAKSIIIDETIKILVFKAWFISLNFYKITEI